MPPSGNGTAWVHSGISAALCGRAMPRSTRERQRRHSRIGPAVGSPGGRARVPQRDTGPTNQCVGRPEENGSQVTIKAPAEVAPAGRCAADWSPISLRSSNRRRTGTSACSRPPGCTRRGASADSCGKTSIGRGSERHSYGFVPRQTPAHPATGGDVRDAAPDAVALGDDLVELRGVENPLVAKPRLPTSLSWTDVISANRTPQPRQMRPWNCSEKLWPAMITLARPRRSRADAPRGSDGHPEKSSRPVAGRCQP